MFLKWDFLTNTVVGLPSNLPHDSGADWFPVTFPAPATSSTQTLEWSLADGEISGLWIGSADPLEIPASGDYITLKHRELESSPIDVFGIVFDADERSEMRIINALAAFDDLPLVEGLVEMVAGVKSIQWRDANNNSHPLTKTVLQVVYTELLRQRGLRGAILFARLQQLKSTVGTHTIAQIDTPAYWGV